MTKAQLLESWRDALRAAELAERLAAAATEASQQAEVRSTVSAEIANLAEQAAASAQRAADRARAAATEAAQLAGSLHDGVPSAESAVAAARETEADARAAYHAAEEPERYGSN